MTAVAVAPLVGFNLASGFDVVAGLVRSALTW